MVNVKYKNANFTFSDWCIIYCSINLHTIDLMSVTGYVVQIRQVMYL